MDCRTLQSMLYFSATGTPHWKFLPCSKLRYPSALCCYDYCLTLGDEIQYVWRNKPSISTILFCGFRYPAVVNTVFMILGLHAWLSWQNDRVSVYN